MKPLSFNMSKFKKIAGDKQSSTMRHDDGHEIKISHAALPALQRKQLERMPLADGGEVDDTAQGGFLKSVRDAFASPTPAPTPEPSRDDKYEAIRQQNKSNMGYAEGGPVVHRANNPKLQQSLVRNPVPSSQNVLKEFYDGGDVDSEQDPVAVDNFVKGFKGVKNYDEGTHNATNDDTSQSSSGPDQSSQHTININVGQPQQPLGQVPPVQGVSTPTGSPDVHTPQVGGPQNVPLNANQTVNFPQAVEQEAKANQDIGKVQGAQAQAQIPLEQQAQQVEQQRSQAINDLANQHIQEFNQFAQELPNIDSNHYMNSMSLPGKLSTALAVFLGSAPTGHGGANSALDFVNKQIERDIQMQKENRDNVKTIYGAYEKLYGDTQAAVDMTRGSMLSIIGHQANIISNKLGTPMAQAQATKLNAIIGQGQASAARSAAFDAVMNTPGGQGKPAPQGSSPQGGSGGGPQLSPKEQEALDIARKNYGQFVPDRIVSPDANSRLAYEAKSNPYMKEDYPKLDEELTHAQQVEKVLNGPKGDGKFGIHDLFGNLYNASGQGKFGAGIGGAAQRGGSGVLATLGGAAGEYIGGPKGAAIGTLLGSQGKIPEVTQAQKEYALNREKIKAELGSSLKGIISVNDLDTMMDKYLPGFMDSPELFKEKEAAFRDTLKKSLETTHLQRYPGFLAK